MFRQNFSKFSPAALKREEILLLGLSKFSKFSPAALKGRLMCISEDLNGVRWILVISGYFKGSKDIARDLAFRNLGDPTWPSEILKI